MDSHYGYGTTVDLGFTAYYFEGFPYRHARIDLIDVNQVKKGLFGNHLMITIGCYAFDEGIPSFDLEEADVSTSIENGTLVSSTDQRNTCLKPFSRSFIFTVLLYLS